MTESRITVRIDELAEAAYIRFNDNRVQRTEEFDDATNVDLDEHGMVVGVELLDLSASVPFGRLVERYHIASKIIKMLEQIAAGQDRTTYTASDQPHPHTMGSISPKASLRLSAHPTSSV